MEFDAALPAHGESLEPVEQGEGLLDDVAESAQALDVHSASQGDHQQDPEPTVGADLDGVAKIFVVLGGPTLRAARLLTPLADTNPQPHRASGERQRSTGPSQLLVGLKPGLVKVSASLTETPALGDRRHSPATVTVTLRGVQP
ncbi:hypothetical protein ACFRAI_38465 [Streptomyces sp. NPDC056637]|uniref:hypothetical protein n=1 Tax=unclassified Streptomyces TaxID=2593676 RepID=UPI0036A10704